MGLGAGKKTIQINPVEISSQIDHYQASSCPITLKINPIPQKEHSYTCLTCYLEFEEACKGTFNIEYENTKQYRALLDHFYNKARPIAVNCYETERKRNESLLANLYQMYAPQTEPI